MVAFTRVQKATAIIPHFSSTLSLVGSGKTDNRCLIILPGTLFTAVYAVAIIPLLTIDKNEILSSLFVAFFYDISFNSF